MRLKLKTALLVALVSGETFVMGQVAEASNFVTIQGSQFYIHGQMIKLKGTNYYPRDDMWADLWNRWNRTVIEQDADRIASLGMNSVRILVPYSHGGWNGPNIPESRMNMLEETVNIFGSRGIRSCITLFDWETSYPDAGSLKETEHIQYLNTIVLRLRNNPFVFMWDVKNEPDHPSAISGHDDWDFAPTQKAKIISWLQRMTNAVKTRSPNQPVSVGLRWYNNVPDIIHFLDIACFHTYWPHLTNGTEIPVIKASMGQNQKPIIAQEFGWPTNPTPNLRDGVLIYDYTEANQLSFYQQVMAAFMNHDIAGCLQWMTYDARTYTSNQTVSFENYFGLWRYDYSLKPAGVYYRDTWPTRLFPVGGDTTPPDPLQSFTATPGDTTIRLDWVNPNTPDFQGTMIRTKAGSFPTSPTDGTLVVNKPNTPGSADTHTVTGLVGGVRYYYAGFAYDQSMNFSLPLPATAIPTTPVGAISIGQARTLADGASVQLNHKVITAVFPTLGSIYVQETDRSAGIRVFMSSVSGYSVGNRVNVAGTMSTWRPNGTTPAERQVIASSVNIVSTTTPPPPVRLLGKAVGGQAHGVIPGVAGATGLNNIGLLVQIQGRVTSKVLSVLHVEDGSLDQSTPGGTTVFVRCPTTSIPVNVGDMVSVTGIIQGNIPPGWSENRRSIIIRDYSDLVKLN